MKKILLGLMLLGALNCTASQTQVKYDTANSYSYVDITPIDVFGDTATRLCVRISDNAVNEGVIYYELRSSNGDVIKRANMYLRGVDYDGYSTNEYLYNWVASKLGLILN